MNLPLTLRLAVTVVSNPGLSTMVGGLFRQAAWAVLPAGAFCRAWKQLLIMTAARSALRQMAADPPMNAVLHLPLVVTGQVVPDLLARNRRRDLDDHLFAGRFTAGPPERASSYSSKQPGRSQTDAFQHAASRFQVGFLDNAMDHFRIAVLPIVFTS